MNNLILEIQEWISKKGIRRFFAIPIIYVALNSLVWNIVEPLISNSKISYYPIFHTIGVGILTIIIYYRFIPQSLLKTINFQSLDGWNTYQGNPQLEIKDDGYFGKIINFEGRHNDCSDYALVGAPTTGNFLGIMYAPGHEFSIYAYIKIVHNETQQYKDVWLCFKYNLVMPRKFMDLEWDYPIDCRIIASTWFKSTIDLRKAVKETFGIDEFEYNVIKGIRVRGSGLLHSITIR